MSPPLRDRIAKVLFPTLHVGNRTAHEAKEMAADLAGQVLTQARNYVSEMSAEYLPLGSSVQSVLMDLWEEMGRVESQQKSGHLVGNAGR
jgi:hypothetical protein